MYSSMIVSGIQLSRRSTEWRAAEFQLAVDEPREYSLQGREII